MACKSCGKTGTYMDRAGRAHCSGCGKVIISKSTIQEKAKAYRTLGGQSATEGWDTIRLFEATPDETKREPQEGGAVALEQPSTEIERSDSKASANDLPGWVGFALIAFPVLFIVHWMLFPLQGFYLAFAVLSSLPWMAGALVFLMGVIEGYNMPVLWWAGAILGGFIFLGALFGDMFGGGGDFGDCIEVGRYAEPFCY